MRQQATKRPGATRGRAARGNRRSTVGPYGLQVTAFHGERVRAIRVVRKDGQDLPSRRQVRMVLKATVRRQHDRKACSLGLPQHMYRVLVVMTTNAAQRMVDQYELGHESFLCVQEAGGESASLGTVAIPGPGLTILHTIVIQDGVFEVKDDTRLR